VYGFIVVLVLLAALWFLMIRPRQQQLKAQQRQIGALEVGDEIVTAGGLYGTVRRIDDDEVRVEIAPDLEVRIAKRAIAGILTKKRPELRTAAETEEEGRYPS
jgi:preprotein translocase subunit YajC